MRDVTGPDGWGFAGHFRDGGFHSPSDAGNISGYFKQLTCYVKIALGGAGLEIGLPVRVLLE